MAKSNVQITEEKANRIAVGATAAGVLVIFFLVIVLIIQFVQIGVRNSQKKELEEQYEYYQELIESQTNDLEYYQTENGLYYLARKEGWS